MASVTQFKKSKETLPTWNLYDLYPGMDSDKLEHDLGLVMKGCKAFRTQYENKVDELSGDHLAEAVKRYEMLQDLAGRIGSYAQLLYAGDMSKPEHGKFYQDISEKLTVASSETLFFTLAINKIGEPEMQEKLKSASLQKYGPWLRDLRAFRKHQLSDEMEKMLLEKSVVGRAAWNRQFDESIAELRFPIGKKKLTSAEAFDLMSSKKPAERKAAAKVIGKVFGENIRNFTLITNTLAKDKEIEDKWRGYKSPISYRNLSNYVEDEVVAALMTAVKQSYPRLSHRYYALKAKWFGKKQLDYWDRNAPLPMDKDKKFSWKEAEELVLSSYAGFSPELAKLGARFFKERWIDVPVRPGKSPGAFAHPTVPSAHPYLLLNFQGKSRDVMTLAHELGHGVHQLLSAKQGALQADTPLTLAETASVFGEQLTFREMLRREKDKKRRKILIAGKVEDMLNTVVRQIAFCEFETRLHDARRQGELSADDIGRLWLSVQSESLGPAIKFYDEYKVYWSYIPHFIHTPFYVYAYAFGDCLVNALYRVYEKEKEAGKTGFEEKYLAMLEAGGTLRHKELLAPFGLDASKPAFWQQGLDIISGFIDELE